MNVALNHPGFSTAVAGLPTRGKCRNAALHSKKLPKQRSGNTVQTVPTNVRRFPWHNATLTELCYACSNDNGLRSTQRGNFAVASTGTRLADGAFTVTGAAGFAAWNSLPTD